MIKVGDLVKVHIQYPDKVFRVTDLKTNDFVLKEYITISLTKLHVDLEKRDLLLKYDKPSTHAWVEGYVVDLDKKYKDSEICGTLDYNPYKFEYFYSVECNMRYHHQGHLINFQIEDLKGHLIYKNTPQT